MITVIELEIAQVEPKIDICINILSIFNFKSSGEIMLNTLFCYYENSRQRGKGILISLEWILCKGTSKCIAMGKFNTLK